MPLILIQRKIKMRDINYKYLLLTYLYFFINPSVLLSQQLISDINITNGISVTSNLKGLQDNLPFWLHSNKNGSIDKNSANINNYISFSGILFKNNYLSIDLETKLLSSLANKSSNHFEVGYIKIELHDYEIIAGRFYDPLTVKENHLSTGSFMYSNNALPIPKIAIKTKEFISIPKTNNIVKYSGFFGHGWFDSNRHTQNVYLHEKYFYLNIKYAFFDAKAGIVHNVQWGGYRGSFKLPSDFRTYREVIFAKGSSSSIAPPGEVSNVVGNSIGAYDFNLGLTFNIIYFNIYRIFYLEDKVSARFRSPWDGIWGVVLKPRNTPLLKNIIYEHINTKKMDSFIWEPRGTANYYNHGIYSTGWTYKNRVIGNPLILGNESLIKPIYNNILIGHHFGLDGQFTNKIKFQLLYTFSRNYGRVEDQIVSYLSNDNCPPVESTVCAELKPLSKLLKINHSILSSINIQSKDERVDFGVNISTDMGDLYGNTAGISISLEYKLIYK